MTLILPNFRCKDCDWSGFVSPAIRHERAAGHRVGLVSQPVTKPGSVPEPSTVGSGCSSKDDRGLPSACFRCGCAIWNGGVHVNGETDCDMWQVPR